MLEYSVIIRTTGKAGEKYNRLLDSINKLDPKPKEVIVVLPERYELPNEKLGWETFYFCPKGMVTQRLFGIEKCRTNYALILDDDISFSSDFVVKLSEPVVLGNYGFSSGPLLEFFPKKGITAFFSFILGASMPTMFHKNRYNSLLRTTGYSYNRKININESKLYETQSAPWTCFFADIEKLRSIHFEDEIWLDMHGYSAHDDTAMFYKGWIRGIKSVIVSDAAYEHLDGKTSTKGNSEKVSYATNFNTIVFWHRYLSGKNLIEKLWSRICIGYRLTAIRLISLIKYLRGKITKETYIAGKKGMQDGWKWIESAEYNKLYDIFRE